MSNVAYHVEGETLRVFEERVLRKIVGPKWGVSKRRLYKIA